MYADLNFPEPTGDRPYVYIDMVATIDGKTLSGDRDESVSDLGSQVDHQLMRRLEAASDAVMIGAGTLRATQKTWSPRTAKRIVVSNSGEIPLDAAFLHEEAYVATSEESDFDLPASIHRLRAGKSKVDFVLLLAKLKSVGVSKLLVLGGSELNAGLLRQNLVDELFLTIAPKIKLGRDVPTYAGGDPLPRGLIQRFELVEHHAVGNELFIRYRRERSG
ncbi:MAG TPA: dihydrofolate reductase family protein [Fimbriimonas sp.]|nr:dihydrofolate reductase family protein [Fimbriimonas sp.]